MTRRQWMAIGVAVVIVVSVGAFFVWRNGHSSNASKCVPKPSAPTEGAAPADRGLRVSEQGFTQLAPDRSIISVGAIVENTSSQPAYRTRVQFGVLDTTGHSAVVPSSSTQLILEIPLILGGQRIPVGSWGYVNGTVSQVLVTLGSTQRLSPQGSYGEVTAKADSTSRTSSDPSTGTVAYTATSNYCEALTPRGVAMVFRGSSGVIVGGSFELGAERCEPGTFTGRATAQRSLPDGVDDTKTQVQPYCDFAAAPPKSAGSAFN